MYDIFSGRPSPSRQLLTGIARNSLTVTVTVNGAIEGYAMTGWPVGYCGRWN